jgi:hypothetical protein
MFLAGVTNTPAWHRLQRTVNRHTCKDHSHTISDLTHSSHSCTASHSLIALTHLTLAPHLLSPGDGIGNPMGTWNRHCRPCSCHSRSSALHVDATRLPLASRLVTNEGCAPSTPTGWQVAASHSCRKTHNTTGLVVMCTGYGCSILSTNEACAPSTPAGWQVAASHSCRQTHNNTTKQGWCVHVCAGYVCCALEMPTGWPGSQRSTAAGRHTTKQG